EAGGGVGPHAPPGPPPPGGGGAPLRRGGGGGAGPAGGARVQDQTVVPRGFVALAGGRPSTPAIISPPAGVGLIVGDSDAGMPAGTSWLPLERVRGADAVLGDLRWLEGLRAVFQRAKAEGVPTVLDADLGAREALEGILRLTDFAIFCAPALRELIPAGT